MTEWKNNERKLLSNLNIFLSLYKNSPFTIWFSKGNREWWCYFLFLLRKLYCAQQWQQKDGQLVFPLNAFSLPHLDFRCQKLFKRSIGEHNCSTCRGKLSLAVPKRYGYLEKKEKEANLIIFMVVFPKIFCTCLCF